MIKSSQDKNTKTFADGHRVKSFHGLKEQAERRLDIFDAAESLHDLAALPWNKFEALSGSRQGQYSIRINKQWRICFKWTNNNADNVEITDYH